MNKHHNAPTPQTPANSAFVEALAEVIAQMTPNASISEVTIRLERDGLGLARGELYARALNIAGGIRNT